MTFSCTNKLAELVSGMEVVVDIIDDKRTIMNYFLMPFNGAASVIFTEN